MPRTFQRWCIKDVCHVYLIFFFFFFFGLAGHCHDVVPTSHWVAAPAERSPWAKNMHEC